MATAKISFATAYNTIRSRKEIPEESMTEQSHKAACDINSIVYKYNKSGVVEHRKEHRGEYGYCDGKTFQEAMYVVQKGKQMFEELPSQLRNKFNHDPAQFLQFVQNSDNVDEMVQLGLAISKDDIPSKTIQKDKADIQYNESPPNPDGGKQK